MTGRLSALAGAFVALFCLAGTASATIYAYTDAQGRIRITDIPDKEGQVIVLPRVTAGNAPAGDRLPAAVSRPAEIRTAPRTSSATSRRSPEEFRTAVQEAAKLFHLSEALIYAVMKAESNFNPYALSRAGAQGLMQLIPSTARLVGVSNSYDPRQNILGGAKYLRMMLDRFGRVDLALAAYNAGPEAVQRYGGIPPFSETRNYVPRVLKFYRDFGGAGELTLAGASTRSFSPTRLASAAARPSTRRSRTTAGDVPVITRSANPIFYYRGPDGQIYISNIR